MERCLSGLWCTPGKGVWCNSHRGFESRPLRQTKNQIETRFGFFICFVRNLLIFAGHFGVVKFCTKQLNMQQTLELLQEKQEFQL